MGVLKRLDLLCVGRGNHWGILLRVMLGLCFASLFFSPVVSLRPLREGYQSWGDEGMSLSSRICHYGDWLDVPTCRCGKEMNIVTAWTDMNPGRRYWECGGKGYRKCHYWEWIDPPMCHRSLKIIPGLLKKKNSMDEEMTMLKKRIKQQAGSKIGAFAFGFVVGILFVCVLRHF